jgi:hypothetical protein
MCWWCIDGLWSIWSWWWVVPLVGIALCITMCLFLRSKMGNRCFSCFPSVDSADPAETKKEILKPKVDTEKTKDRKGD